MSERIRVMLHSKFQGSIDKLKEETGCGSLTHLLHVLIQWVANHPEQSEQIKEYIRQHDYKKE